MRSRSFRSGVVMDDRETREVTRLWGRLLKNCRGENNSSNTELFTVLPAPRRSELGGPGRGCPVRREK